MMLKFQNLINILMMLVNQIKEKKYKFIGNIINKMNGKS